MENTIQSDLIRGHINTIILKVLFDGDRYGYDIVREIEQKSSGQYKLKQPTLYSCLKRLEIQGFIRSYWGAKSNGGRRKYFTLTEMGRELFIKNQTEWEYSRTVIDKLISDKEVDLSEYNAGTLRDGEGQDETEDEINEEQSEDESGEEQIEADDENEQIEEDEEEIGEKQIEDEEQAEVEEDNEQIEETDEVTTEEHAENKEQVAADDEVAPTAPEIETANDEEGQVISDEELNKLLGEMTESEDENSEDGETTEEDVSSEMDKLLNAQNGDSSAASYADQLASEDATSESSDRYFSSDDYFNDYFDANEQRTSAGPIAPAEEREEFEQGNEEILDRQSYENAVAEQQNSTSDSLQSSQGESVSAERPSPPEFLDYHTSYPITQRSDSEIIESEYRNIIGDFLDQCFISRQAETKPKTPVEEPGEPPIPEESAATEPTPNPIETYTSDTAANRKLNDLAGEVREMGADIKIRTHKSESSKEYNSAYYYYSNKLMLTHYGILFGIMMVEILLSAVLVHLVIGKAQVISGSALVWYYVASVVIALAFPVFAFICNFRNSDKRKRISFNLKNQLIFRFIVLAQCLLIIYCANVIGDMSVGFGIEYLITLLLPALMCINIPISALIFNALYKSGRYSVKD